MDKKAKIALAVIKKVYDKFPETQKFIDKAYVEECCKENTSVNKVFFSINNNCYFFFCVMLLCFSPVCHETHHFLLYLIGSKSF